MLFVFERWNEFWSLFRRRRGAEEPDEEPAVRHEIHGEGELITYEECPIKLYLHTKLEFTDTQKKYMLHLMWHWYNNGEKDPLSDISLQIMISFNMYRYFKITREADKVFHISIY